MRVLTSVCSLVAMIVFSCGAGYSAPYWARSYGGVGEDKAYDIQTTSDGGYIMAGSSDGSFASSGLWLLKLDGSGNTSWEQTYELLDTTSVAYSVQQTLDGGYIVAGSVTFDPWADRVVAFDNLGSGDPAHALGAPYPGRVPAAWDNYAVQINPGGYLVLDMGEAEEIPDVPGYDFYVEEVDEEDGIARFENDPYQVYVSDDAVTWHYLGNGLGDTEFDIAGALPEARYVKLVGVTRKSEIDAVEINTVLAELPDSDFWVLKTDEFGNIEWQSTYGGSLEERAFSVYPTLDMGYIVAGYVELEGDNYDAWVVKLDEMGFVSWEKRYGGSDAGSYSVRETSDGGYILAGYIKLGTGGDDLWVVKLDEDGTLSWERAYGGEGEEDERAFWIEETSGGGYIVTGRTRSFGAGGHDVWVLKLDENGDVGTPGSPIPGTWQKTYGGPDRDVGNSVRETSDGGYIVAGYTDIYISAEEGWLPDSWLLKLDAAGSLVWDKTYGGPGSDVAWTVQESANHTYVLGGYTDSFGAGGWDAWAVNVKEGGEIADCALMGETTATVAATDATGAAVGASASPTLATKVDTEADVQPTSAQVATQCEEYPGDLDCDEIFGGVDVLIQSSIVVDLITWEVLPSCIESQEDMLVTSDWDCNGRIDGTDVLIGASIIVDILTEGDTPLGWGCP